MMRNWSVIKVSFPSFFSLTLDGRRFVRGGALPSPSFLLARLSRAHGRGRTPLASPLFFLSFSTSS